MARSELLDGVSMDPAVGDGKQWMKGTRIYPATGVIREY